MYVLSWKHDKYYINLSQNLPELIVQNNEQYLVELIFDDLLLWTIRLLLYIYAQITLEEIFLKGIIVYIKSRTYHVGLLLLK